MCHLFSCLIYEFNSIILQHTQETISKINCKYIIKFYISRIIYMIKQLIMIVLGLFTPFYISNDVINWSISFIFVLSLLLLCNIFLILLYILSNLYLV